MSDAVSDAVRPRSLRAAVSDAAAPKRRARFSRTLHGEGEGAVRQRAGRLSTGREATGEGLGMLEKATRGSESCNNVDNRLR